MNHPQLFTRSFLFISLAALLTACSSEDTTSACTPLPAASFNCADPAECLSVTATWCYPGAAECTNLDADLSLELPGGTIIGVGAGEIMSANGCTLDGDEQANALTGPYDENITCSPYVHPAPPDRIDTGRYVIYVDEFNVFSTDVRLDINKDGTTSCQIVNTATVPVSVELMYP